MFLKSYQANKSTYGDPEPVPYVSVVNGKAKVSGYSARVIGQLYVSGMPLADIEAEYNLTPAEIFAAVSYYYDFKDMFDAEDRAYEQRYKASVAQTTTASAVTVTAPVAAVAAVGAATVAVPSMTVLKNPNRPSTKINYAPRKRK
jgi:uncharacterized protein (DUF433 family)